MKSRNEKLNDTKKCNNLLQKEGWGINCLQPSSFPPPPRQSNKDALYCNRETLFNEFLSNLYQSTFIMIFTRRRRGDRGEYRVQGTLFSLAV